MSAAAAAAEGSSSASCPKEAGTVEAPAPQEDDFKVLLQSEDGEQVEILKSVGVQSKLVANMAEEFVAEETNLVPLPSIKKDALLHVVDYLNYHRDNKAEKIERPLKSPLEDVICDWDREFLTRFELQGLFDLVLGANYMDIKPLLRLGAAQIFCKYIRGKSPEQIRETFGLPDDITPEDQARIREENRWCEEA